MEEILSPSRKDRQGRMMRLSRVGLSCFASWRSLREVLFRDDQIVLAATAHPAALGAAVRARHEADVAAAARSAATILVMPETALAVECIAGRQGQRRGLPGEKAMSGETMRSAARIRAGEDRNGVVCAIDSRLR
jgi:hypothetical protein